MAKKIVLNGKSLSLDEVLQVACQNTEVMLANACEASVRRSRDVLEKLIRSGKVMYGVNTGFGRFAEISIPKEDIRLLQRKIVLSHAAGVGEPFPDSVVRAILLIKANSLASGFSGVRPEVIHAIVQLLNRGIHPVIPSRGSVGASGDLAPLAHMALTLLGEGEARVDGKVLSGMQALESKGLLPLELEAKEGLALLNGTQAMNGLGAILWSRARNCYRCADVIGAMSVEGLSGSRVPFDPRIQNARGHEGQKKTAANLFSLLKGSAILKKQPVKRVQEAYSLRCMPQVHGAGRDMLDFVESILSIEINAATDNPLVFTKEKEVLSGGNFHGEPLALSFDSLTMSLSGLSGISERRIAYLMDSNHSGLPGFLAVRKGLDSGFMIAQVTAAALVSENKILSHPACVDSVPTSANQEDYVSMGMNAANKAMQVVENTERILAIELLTAAQAVDFRAPLAPSPVLKKIHQSLRELVPSMIEDRVLAPDMEAAATWIRSGALLSTLGSFNLL